MGLSVVTYALCKKYVDESLQGGGALKGKNCTIDDISTITGGHRVTFKWTLDDGTVQTGYMDVMDGVDGVDGTPGQDGAPGQEGPQGEQGPAGNGINSMEVRSINGMSHLILTYTNAPSVEVDCGIIESSAEGKVFHDDDDWIPFSFEVRGMSHSTFIPNGEKRTFIIDELSCPVSAKEKNYVKVLKPMRNNNEDYNLILENNHKYFLMSDDNVAEYLQEIVEGDGESHDYSEKKPVIIDLTETFGAGFEPSLSDLLKALGTNSEIYNNFGTWQKGWVLASSSSDPLTKFELKGRKANGDLITIEDFAKSNPDPSSIIYYPGYKDNEGNEFNTSYNYKNNSMTWTTNSDLTNSGYGAICLKSSILANNFIYHEDGSKHYLIYIGRNYRVWGSTYRDSYDPSLNPSKKLNMRVYFTPLLSFDGISANELMSEESRTSENSFYSFAGVSTPQFDGLSLNSDYYYLAWRYDDCNSIEDFFLKWGYDLTELDNLTVPVYIVVTTVGIALDESDWVVSALSSSLVKPESWIINIDEDIVDLHLYKKERTNGNVFQEVIKFSGRELLDGCKISSEDLISSQNVYLEKINPKAFGSFILNNGTVESSAGVSLFDSSKVTSLRGIAAGSFARAIGPSCSIAIGDSTLAEESYAIAMGNSAQATGEGAVSIGRKHYWTESGQIYYHDQSASAAGAVSIGTGCRASGEFSLALIKDSEATNEHSIAMGYNALASGKNAFAGGYYTTATGENAFAYGYRARATSNNAVAIGGSASAINTGCISLGTGSETTWAEGIAIGVSAHSYHNYCIAIGKSTTAQGASAIAVGHQASAPVECGIAIGHQATVSRAFGIAIGYNTKISGTSWAAIAMGEGSTANGDRAIAIGTGTTTANGAKACAIGWGIKANGTYISQVAIGKYNIEDTNGDYAFIIGNGTADNARSNLLTVSASGVIEAANLPAAPAAQGSYVLTCTVDANGDATYSWESTT